MKTHYVLQKLFQGQQYVGDDWELDPDNTTCRNKLTSATTMFGADDTCPWCIELGVERTLPRDVGIPTPYPIEGGRYVLTVCSPSFVDDPRGMWYFEDDDEAKPLIMNTLDYDAITEFVETKLKEYTFTSTPDDPYGDDVEFRNVTKHWLYDADWNDYH